MIGYVNQLSVIIITVRPSAKGDEMCTPFWIWPVICVMTWWRLVACELMFKIFLEILIQFMIFGFYMFFSQGRMLLLRRYNGLNETMHDSEPYLFGISTGENVHIFSNAADLKSLRFKYHQTVNLSMWYLRSWCLDSVVYPSCTYHSCVPVCSLSGGDWNFTILRMSVRCMDDVEPSPSSSAGVDHRSQEVSGSPLVSETFSASQLNVCSDDYKIDSLFLQPTSRRGPAVPKGGAPSALEQSSRPTLSSGWSSTTWPMVESRATLAKPSNLAKLILPQWYTNAPHWLR